MKIKFFRRKKVSLPALTLIILPLAAVLFYASSEGPLSTEKGGKSNYGTEKWGSTGNAKLSDNRYTDVDLADTDSSEYFECTMFGFGIPIGASIDGIEVTIERSGESNALKDASVKIIKGGAVGGTEHKSASVWPTADEPASYGGSSDLWGLAWIDGDINANDFGVAIAAKRAVSTGTKKTASIDHVQIKVYYTVPLPVELLSFKAESAEKEVELKWTTASEKNNDFYTIERSGNGTSFTAIAKTDGAGNTSSKRDYTYRDSDPLQGTSYYRLAQTDFDGKTHTYNPVSVNRLSSAASPCTFSVYPNPCPGNCNVILDDCPGAKEKEITLALFDAAGNKVMTNVLLRDDNGSFNFSIDTKNNLMPGVYIVQASNESEKYSKKVIVKN